MIQIGNLDIYGFEPAIRGMRNPMNSWNKSDSLFFDDIDPDFAAIGTFDINGCYIAVANVHEEKFSHLDEDGVYIGPNDYDLMMKLANAGSEHSKYRRMIVVYCDILAPLYWWKEFDTYKVGTVANSCSTMHKIHARKFELSDFSNEQLGASAIEDSLEHTIEFLNIAREMYIQKKSKAAWWQMIQLLPSSYNQKRTVMLNYEVLSHIYKQRKDHKLDEWREFCRWIEELPYSELITLEVKDDEQTGRD